MAIANIKLKGLSSEQISTLLPEGLISLCWRGSVAHGMYVPKSDPNSIDDKDLMGIYIEFKKMISFNQEAQALMQQLEEQLTSFGINPDSADDGHSLRRLDGQPFVGATTGMMEVVKRYRGERHRYYSGGYMGQKRRELVRRVGYDAKNAAHLIRLLRMGIEFLSEGTLHVERADATELLDIKRGDWPLEKVKAEAERLFQLAQEAYVRSSLPPEPDRQRAEQLCVEMISEYHGLDTES
jgi:hypothetical protein